jgi:RimJ/RimL family protein N-acetyltransferase
MHLTKTVDQTQITQIIIEPKLWAVEYGQGNKLEDFTVDLSFDYLLIQDEDQDNEVLGLFQVRSLTKIILEAHIYLLPKYWGKDYAKRSVLALFEYVRTQTRYHKVLTDVPASCKHVIKLMKKIGAEQCGYIKEGVVYNNTLQTLLLFDKKIVRI